MAEGAVSYYIDHYVATRMARVTYGTNCNFPYQRDKASHIARADLVYVGADGRDRLDHCFYKLLDKASSTFLRDYRSLAHSKHQ